MPRGDGHNHHAPTASAHNVRTDHCIRAVVAALDDDIGLQSSHDFERRVLAEHDNSVDAFQAGENERPFRLRSHRTRRTLESAHRGIAVHANDEPVPCPPRGHQHVDMTGVQEIEDAVGEDDGARAPLAPGTRRIPIEDFAGGVERQAQNGPDACGLIRTSLTKPGSSTTW